MTEGQLRDIFSHFQVNGTFEKGEAYGSGHINDTYLVETQEADCHNYIVQRINHNIFSNVPMLMDNIARVTQHMRKKLSEIPGADPDRQTLTVIPANDDKPFYQDVGGDYWRVYIYIANTRSYDIVENASQAYEGGRAFGQFQRLLADMPGGPLYETIEDFHNIDSRLDLFQDALEADKHNRAVSAAAEIEFVQLNFADMRAIVRLGAQGKIPLRVTHNDTKFNNVLLDENDKGLCVIDLDTVMPGYVHYDFGDSIRTATNTAAEDEADLSKVGISLDLFEGYTKGFLEEVGATLNKTEIEYLPFSAQLLPFTIGLRFLTDHLDGDNYFKIHHEGHNLQRARAQFQLVKSAQQQLGEMMRIVNDIVRD